VSETKPRCVWCFLAPDTDVLTGQTRQTVAVGPWQPSYTDMPHLFHVSLKFFEHEYGDIPKPNTARLVDTSRNEWWCPVCNDWKLHAIRWVGDGLTGEMVCGTAHSSPQRVTKSRAFVVEEIKLEEAK